jgi:pre-rRNA-processing protein TSR3
MRECDPRKCTALKLGRLGLAKVVYNVKGLPRGSLLLYPFAKEVLSPQNRSFVAERGISAIDCSWNRIEKLPSTGRFVARHLPFLLAANPIHYSIPYKLSTLEAVAATLYITGFEEEARSLLSKMKWGPTFLTLNKEPLSLYSTAKNGDAIKKIEEDYKKAYNI